MNIQIPVEEKNIEPSAEWLAEVPVEQVKKATDHIKAAAEMGDVSTYLVLSDP